MQEKGRYRREGLDRRVNRLFHRRSFSIVDFARPTERSDGNLSAVRRPDVIVQRGPAGAGIVD